jgi:hypothetical protein
LEDDGVFSVGSMYKKRAAVMAVEEGRGVEENHVLAQIWKSPASYKVVALAWKGLLDRIPTRVNLVRRNVLPNNATSNCVFCKVDDETNNHIFLDCMVSWSVWSKLQN